MNCLKVIQEAKRYAIDRNHPFVVYEIKTRCFQRTIYDCVIAVAFDAIVREEKRPVIKLLTVYPDGRAM